MMTTARSRQLLLCGFAAGAVAAASFAGATASAEPMVPSPPGPVPAPIAGSGASITPNAVGTGPVPMPPGATSPAVPAAGPAPTAAAGGVPGAVTQPTPPGHPALVPARSGTLRDYFAAKQVALEPQKPEGFAPLDITLPVPSGWTQVPDPNVVDAFAVIADRNAAALYTPNAQVVVYKLVGDFDPNEAITHGFVDSQQQMAWQTTNASLGEFSGFPSSVIEGTYRQNDMTLNTSQRHLIATSGSDKYLVSLAVTTLAARAIGTAPATEAIVNGFRVAVPAATHASGTPAQPPAAAVAPGPPAATMAPRPPGPARLPVAPTLPGLQG
jgi:hypothetical protein